MCRVSYSRSRNIKLILPNVCKIPNDYKHKAYKLVSRSSRHSNKKVVYLAFYRILSSRIAKEEITSCTKVWSISRNRSNCKISKNREIKHN